MYICIHICTNISDKKDLWRQHCVLCYCNNSIYIYIFIKLTLDHYIVQHNKQLIQVALVIVNYHTCLEWCSTPFLGTNITCYIRYFKSCLALLVYCILGYTYIHTLFAGIWCHGWLSYVSTSTKHIVGLRAVYFLHHWLYWLII